MDYIDVLPPGLYETSISRADERADAGLIEREYLLEFTPRTVAELDREIGHRPDDDARFATVARISEINLGLYRLFLQPWVRALSTPESAKWMRRRHPNRLGYRLLSDRNPLTLWLPALAEKVRADRHPVGEDNVFRRAETLVSEQIARGLDTWRDLRDKASEQLFLDIYGQPLLQVLVGLRADGQPHRRRPGTELEHRRFIERRQAELHARVAEGGSHEAMMRSTIYVLGGAPATDERNFKRMRATRAELEPGLKLVDFKHLLREQFFILKHDREAALEAIPALLKGQSAAEIDAHLKQIEHVLAASGDLSAHAADRFERIKSLFRRARPNATEVAPMSAGAAAESPPAGMNEPASPAPVAMTAEPQQAVTSGLPAAESQAAQDSDSGRTPDGDKAAAAPRRRAPRKPRNA